MLLFSLKCIFFFGVGCADFEGCCSAGFYLSIVCVCVCLLGQLHHALLQRNKTSFQERLYQSSKPLSSTLLNIIQLSNPQSLTTARTNHLSTQLLITALSDLPSKAAADLPSELHSVIEIVTAQLSGRIPASDREILTGDIDVFLQNINSIADALSTQLSVVAEYLCRIADPTTPPAVQDLSAKASALQRNATHALPHSLQEAHLGLTNSTTALLSTYLTLLKTSIHTLETTQHGSLARHTRSSATLLHTRATLQGLQAQLHALSHPPPREFVAALKACRKQQGSGEKALRDREALALRERELYARAGEKGMRDLARRKEGLVREIGRMEGEVGRLQQGRGE